MGNAVGWMLKGGRLASDCLAMGGGRYESWVTAAVYCTARQDVTKALELLDKVGGAGS